MIEVKGQEEFVTQQVGEFTVKVKVSEIEKNKKLLSTGKLKRIEINNPKEEYGDLWKECVLEVKINSAGYNYSLWPLMFGYYGKSDGFEYYSNTGSDLTEEFLDMCRNYIQKESKDGIQEVKS